MDTNLAKGLTASDGVLCHPFATCGGNREKTGEARVSSAYSANAAERPDAHVEGPDGWCAGCLREGRLTFHPCYLATSRRAAGDQPPAGPGDKAAP